MSEKNYTYFVEDDYKGYLVVENPTGQVIKQGASNEDARTTTRMLNNGAGFDGWTPAFLLAQIKI